MGLFKYIKSWFVKEVERSIEDLMKQYINNKLFVARTNGWVGTLEREAYFLNKIGLMSCDERTLKDRGVVYKNDVNCVGNYNVQWDYQFDTITTFTRGGGDCNSLNRIAQVFKFLETGSSYLVTYVAKDPTKNHTTCVFYNDTNHHWYTYDYGIDVSINYETCKDAIDSIAKKYNTEVLNYVIQDENWNFVDY